MQIKNQYLLMMGAGCVLFGLMLATRRPGMVTNPKYLGGLLLAEIIIFCAWRYESRFFPVLIVAFLWAGAALPFKYLASSVRWVFLAAAAGIGFAVWVRDKRYKLGKFHLAASFSVAAALASSLVSTVPKMASLKVASVAMLFLYGATGARISFWRDPAKFTKALVIGCEVMVLLSGIVYLLLKMPVFGNPNSLGAVMAFVEPLLFWQVLVTADPHVRYRRVAAVCLSGMLLYTSAARAAILAAAVATVLVCVVLQRYRVLPKLAFASVLLISLAGVIQPDRFPDLMISMTGNLIYKRNVHEDIFESRMNPWNQSVDSIKKHPWLGSGFGTTDSLSVNDTMGQDPTRSVRKFEYGNSYLGVLDYTGLVGALTFGSLILLLAWRVVAISFSIWKNGDQASDAVPFVLIVTVGLIHAIFEDWLFAPGSYVCIFFWSSAFLLMDFVPFSVKAVRIGSTLHSGNRRFVTAGVPDLHARPGAS